MYRRRDDSMEIDVGTVTTRQQLHDLLFQAFRFPDYYGSNWDAFDECIRDVPVPSVIQVRHFEVLRSRLPREAELMSGCLSDFTMSREPKVTVEIS